MQGLGYSQANGEPRVLINQHEDGTDIVKLVVYRAAPGGFVFSPAQKLLEIDTNVADVDFAALGDYWNGEPSFSIQYMNPTAPTWDIGFFLADGPGSWTEAYTWYSTLEGGWPKHCLDDAGNPIGAAIEFGSGAQGRVKVCYPW
ncbi:hypothetical protein JW859_07045 [bacterium]|nr:hypothetical protein [bacterium]